MLGVDPTADAEAVRLAYRRRIRAAHPDRAGATAHQTASAINAAWWVLRDPARRAAYDRQRQAARRPTGGPAVASRRPGPAAAGGSVLGRADLGGPALAAERARAPAAPAYTARTAELRAAFLRGSLRLGIAVVLVSLLVVLAVSGT